MSVVVINNRYRQGRSRERSPLGHIAPRPPTVVVANQTSRPLRMKQPLITTTTGTKKLLFTNTNEIHVKITTGRTGIPFIFLVILAQVVAFIFFYDLPNKIHNYNKATVRMREQQDAMRKEARHLESERIALRGESGRLEKQRLELESTILELEGERDALESAIRRSEQERLRLGQEKQLLDDERRLMEREKEEWREERERWEKARKVHVPQGAFWAAGPMACVGLSCLWETRVLGRIAQHS